MRSDPAPIGEDALGVDVGGLALGRLDAHRRVPEVGEVVGRGAHVELADVAGEGERVEQELTGHERAELVRPLVEVHPGVQAPRLLELDLAFPRRAQGVPRRGRGREEAVGVEVGAADPVGLDDLVGAGRAESQRDGVPCGVVAVHHRPLVQAEAPELGRPVRGGPQETGDEVDGRGPLAEQGRVVDADAVVLRDVVPPAGALAGADEDDPRPRVPAAQPRRAGGVVGVEEVLDGVALAPRLPRPVPGRQVVGPGGVRVRPPPPLPLRHTRITTHAASGGGGIDPGGPPGCDVGNLWGSTTRGGHR